ncbi:MAG: DNA polymerase III subunit delta [Proteobacteria bacterium]|nr:DNA polymerase III subunit delta [Pseudomonadota bacterium]
MPAKPAEFAQSLKGRLAPLYVISGDETLLVEESCDAVLNAARANGFTERTVHHADKRFNWNDLTEDAASMSLFADRKVLDVRATADALGKDAVDVLKRYVDKGVEDTLVLLRVPQLDASRRKSAWFKTLEDLAVMLIVWPVDAKEMPRWLTARLLAAGLDLDSDAIGYLSQRVEGNLLAAMQAVEKLKLADLPSPIAVHDVVAVVEDSAHYNVFELIDAVFAGRAPEVARMLRSMREEGASEFAIMGVLVSQMRMLDAGRKLFGARARDVPGLMRRVGSAAAVLSQCALIDVQAKGGLRGEAWESVETLLLRMAGARSLPSMERDLAYRRF